MPDNDPFFLIEKRPITQYKTDNKSDPNFKFTPEEPVSIEYAKSTIPELKGRINMLSDAYTKPQKISKAYYWMQEYKKYFPFEIGIFYEDDEIIVYHLKQPDSYALIIYLLTMATMSDLMQLIVPNHNTKGLIIYMERKEILIIMPAYNEAACIGGFLDKLTEANVKSFADVLVVNDGSTDDTSLVVKSKGFGIISHVYNLGYGSALQTGYKYAVRNEYKYVIQLDSDGQHDVRNIENIVKALKAEDNNADIIIGSRFLSGSETFYISPIKMIAIKMFRLLIKKSANQVVLDPTSGLQGLNKDAFLFYSFYNNFDSNYPDANMIIQVSLNDFIIKEIPAVMHVRETGKSMHSGLKPVMYILKMLVNVMIVIIREKYFKKKW